jgi:hypothetical protein
MLEFLIVLAVLAAAVLVVTAPLRGHARVEQIELAELAELRAAKEAKYREIRDAELDHRTGKLSDEDWRDLDRQLRREAVAVLRRLDEWDTGEERDGPDLPAPESPRGAAAHPDPGPDRAAAGR